MASKPTVAMSLYQNSSSLMRQTGRMSSLLMSSSGTSVSILCCRSQPSSRCEAASANATRSESRNDPSTSPTSIYLGGGPGSTSLDGLSGFPCLINPDSNSTTLNKFSWNNNVNMLYIDQPVGTGFTYVTLQNGLFDVLAQTFEPVLDEDDLPPLNHTTLQATLDVSGLSTAANTTMSAARTTWAFAQVWFNEYVKRGSSGQNKPR